MASKAKQSKQGSIGAGKNEEVRTGNKEELRRIRNGGTSKSATETLVRERNSYLQEEYEVLTAHLNGYMGRVEHLLRENKFLEEEAKRNRKESNVYLCYLLKHSQKCPNLVITLNEHYETHLSQVQQQKEELISRYAEKEKEVRNRLAEMEAKCSLMNGELEDLQPFKDLRLEQTKKIKELEKELLVTKIHHSEEMHKITSSFLQARAHGAEGSGQKIRRLTRRAEAAAAQSLLQHIQQVKAENRRLRRELLGLIRLSKALTETQAERREQQLRLLRQQRSARHAAGGQRDPCSSAARRKLLWSSAVTRCQQAPKAWRCPAGCVLCAGGESRHRLRELAPSGE